jgi:aryl-alcohol dehydrogenase-like predicted oxidoreductase
MKYIKLGSLNVSRIGLGAMGMSGAYTGAGTDDAESIRTIHRALDLGVTFIDTAETYGPFTNEELVGRAIKGHRDKVVLATKFGRISHAGGGRRILDSSPANIRTAAEGSLKRLGTDHIDLYYQHRVDPASRSRTRSARWPRWWPRARSATSACPRPGPPRSAAPTPSTPSPRCSRSTLCGPATLRQMCCR